MNDASETITNDYLSQNYGSLAPASKENESSRSAHHNEMPHLSSIAMSAILSSSFSYGCIMTTLFILTLPIECQRIEQESSEYYSYTIRKSIALGGFAAIAGLSQLVSPLIGLLSDNFEPRGKMRQLGTRLPYLILGTILVTFGMIGQLYSSSPIHKLAEVNESITRIDDYEVRISPKTAILGGAWVQYSIFFVVASVGLNVAYTVMMAMIPDYVPRSQTGAANGTLALLLVLGSLFGFGMFHIVLDQSVLAMYKLYTIVTATSGIVTYTYVCDREKTLKESQQSSYVLKPALEEEERVHKENIDEGDATNKAQEDQSFPAIHDLGFILLYEPLLEKTQSEILSAFWIDISQHRDFFVVTISRFFYYMGISTQTFFLYFIHDELAHSQQSSNPEAAVALLAIIGQTAGAITCYPVGIISDQYFDSRRKPFVYLACICLGLGNLALVLCTDWAHMMMVVFLLGAANGIYLTMDTSLAVDTLDVDDDGSTGNSNIHAQLLGVWGVFGFLGSAFGPLLGGCVLTFVGRQDTSPDQFYSFEGYQCLFSLTAVYFLLSSVSLAFVKKKGV